MAQFPEIDLSGLPDDEERQEPYAVTDMDLDLSGLPDQEPNPIPEPPKYEPQPDPVTLFRNRSVMEKPGWLERFRTPLTDIGRRTATSINEMIPDSEHPLAKFGESAIGFLGGAVDEMTAPINALPLALTGGGSALAKYGLGALGKLATGAGRVTSAPAALSGYDRMKNAETIPEWGMGALEAVGGMFGMRGPKGKVAKQVIPPAATTETIIPEGHVRLYRSGRLEPHPDATNPVLNFTPDYEHAKYFSKAGKKPTHYIDIPLSEIENFRGTDPPFDTDLSRIGINGGDGRSGPSVFQIPAERAKQAKPVTMTPSHDYAEPAIYENVELKGDLPDEAFRAQRQNYENLLKQRQLKKWGISGTTDELPPIGHPEHPVTPKVDLPDYSPSSELAARKVLADKGIQVSPTMSNKQIIDNARAVQGATNPVEKLAKEAPEIAKPGAPKPKVRYKNGKFFHEDYPDYILDKDGNITGTLSGNPVRTPREIEPNVILEILNTPRAVNASADLSFPLRQGITLMHKPGWWKAWGDMAKSFGSEQAFKGTMDSILEKPNYIPNIKYKKFNPTSKKMEPTSFADWAGLTITDNATLRELEHMRSFAERVPGYKQIVHSSNRGYTAFANKLRSDTFDSLVDDFTKAGMDPRTNQELAKSIASFVNSASGRGSMESLERHMEALNIAFFSPRLQISRAQMLGRSARAIFDPKVYDMSAPNIRREYLKSMLALGTAWSTVAGLANMAGAEVALDPTNPDFMKVKIGNTRLDMGGGFQQFIVLANKLAQQRATSSTKVDRRGNPVSKDFADAKTPFDPTELSTLKNFGYSKLAPIPRAAIDLTGRTQKEPFDLIETAARLGSPILVQDLMEIYMNEGDPSEYAATVPSFFGVGSQTYGEGIDFRRRMLGPNFGKSLAFPQKTR